MERNDHVESDLIDLGLATEETKGGNIADNDFVGGQLPDLGLSDD